MSLIIQGNRFGGMLAVHVGGLCVASGNAHMTSLIQTQGKVDSSFIEALSYTETHWELSRHDADPQLLAMVLGVSPADVHNLRAAPLFGTVRCVRGPSKKLPWALDVQLVADDKYAVPVAALLRSALTDEHLFYVFVIELSGFSDSANEPGRPTLKQFKEGAPYYFFSAHFSLKAERYPGLHVRVEASAVT